MKTQYYTASSLDGFIADKDHGLDWLFQFGSEPTDDYPQFLAALGALCMGSSTYEWLLDHHIMPPNKPVEPWPYTQPTWVFTSRTLRQVPGANIHFVRGDVGPVHDAMVAAAGEKNRWIVGGGELVGQFFDRGLLDEIIVTIASVTLGSGAPLLPRRIVTPPLRLMSTRTFGSSYAQLTYQVQKPG